MWMRALCTQRALTRGPRRGEHPKAWPPGAASPRPAAVLEPQAETITLLSFYPPDTLQAGRELLRQAGVGGRGQGAPKQDTCPPHIEEELEPSPYVRAFLKEKTSPLLVDCVRCLRRTTDFPPHKDQSCAFVILML